MLSDGSKLPSGIRIADVINIGIQSKLLRAVRPSMWNCAFFLEMILTIIINIPKQQEKLLFLLFAAFAMPCPQKAEIVQTVEHRIRRLNTITTRNYRCWVLLSIVLVSLVLWAAGVVWQWCRHAFRRVRLLTTTCHFNTTPDNSCRETWPKNMAQKRSQVHFDRYLWHDWLGSSVVHNKKRFLRQVSSASEASVLISPRAPLPSKVKCNFNQLVSASFRFVLNASRDELHTHRPISGELITTLCVKWAGDKCQTLLLPAAVIFYFALCRRLFHNGSLNWNKLPGDDDDLASAAATARSPHFSNQFKKPFSNHISDSELSLRL